jgi:hypothetical protein
MNPALTIFITNFTHLFLDDPRGAFLLRTCNKNVRRAFDKFLKPATWWFWIQYFFIPNIVGMPCDLKPEFYMSVLDNYFAPSRPLWTRMRCKYMLSIGNDLHGGSSNFFKINHILIVNSDLMISAKGRAFLLGMINEWEECLGEDVADVLSTVRNFIRYSFFLEFETTITAGHNGQEHNKCDAVLMEGLFKKWRV